jgi:hypothetical protein
MRWMVAEIMVASSTRACFGLAEIGRVTFYVENHVAGTVADNGIGMRGAIV